MYRDDSCVNVTPLTFCLIGPAADTFDHAAVLATMYAIGAEDHKGKGSWRRIAEIIGYGSPAMWSQAAKGAKLSLRAENELRLMLGIAPRGQPDLDSWSPRTVRRYMAGRRPYRVA